MRGARWRPRWNVCALTGSTSSTTTSQTASLRWRRRSARSASWPTRAGSAFGVSNFDAAQLREAAALGDPRLAALQNEYSLLERDAERELLPLCREHGIGFVPYFPLARGRLSGKFRRGDPLPADSRMADRPDLLDDAVFDHIEALERFAAEHGHSLLELAIAGLVAQPGVVSVIAGAMSAEQVTANAAAGTWELAPDWPAAKYADAP